MGKRMAKEDWLDGVARIALGVVTAGIAAAGLKRAWPRRWPDISAGVERVDTARLEVDVTCRNRTIHPVTIDTVTILAPSGAVFADNGATTINWGGAAAADGETSYRLSISVKPRTGFWGRLDAALGTGLVLGVTCKVRAPRERESRRKVRRRVMWRGLGGGGGCGHGVAPSGDGETLRVTQKNVKALFAPGAIIRWRRPGLGFARSKASGPDPLRSCRLGWFAPRPGAPRMQPCRAASEARQVWRCKGRQVAQGRQWQASSHPSPSVRPCWHACRECSLLVLVTSPDVSAKRVGNDASRIFPAAAPSFQAPRRKGLLTPHCVTRKLCQP